MGVVGVKADQDSLVVFGNLLDLLNDFERNAGALDHLNTTGHWVSLNGGSVVDADVDIDAYHFTA